MSWEIRQGDCIEQMAKMEEASVDAVVCDPPYNLSFMSKAWDRVDGESVDPAFLHWFAGFVDGEGCFSVHKKTVNGCEVFDCQFSITLRADDRPILERIQRTLGIGTLSKPTAHRGDGGPNGNSKPKARYSISRKADCHRLREIFRGFPLRAKKAQDMELWSDALDAWVAHEPGSGWDDVAEARGLLMASRAYAEDGIRVDPFQMWCWRWGREALRVLKPGGHCLAFGGTRTHHRLAAGLEDAGFEIRDSLSWMFGSGFPKSLDVSKAIDKAAGAEREVVGQRVYEGGEAAGRSGGAMGESVPREPSMQTAPATPEAARWEGWGTALKPGHEPIVVARKPLIGSVAENALEHGTGGLNIDACRIGVGSDKAPGGNKGQPRDGQVYGVIAESAPTDYRSGRWPANVVLSHHEDCELVGTKVVKPSNGSGKASSQSGGISGVFGEGSEEDMSGGYGTETVEAWNCAPGCPVAELDRQSGRLQSGSRVAGVRAGMGYHGANGDGGPAIDGDSGGASRFFYCAKTSRAERNAGLEGFQDVAGPDSEYGMKNKNLTRKDQGAAEVQATKNGHPTVKPINLMRWLVRLVTPPDGLILDPFLGSGSTGLAAVLEGFDFLGIEREPDYVEIAEARISFWARHQGRGVEEVLGLHSKSQRESKEHVDRGQVSIDDLLASEAGA